MNFYHVTEAVYTDTDFKTEVEGTYVDHGLVDTKEKALALWKKYTFTPNIDIATHRVSISHIHV